MSQLISLAPLQGITDHYYRNLYHQHFGGVDAYYTPFIRLEKDKQIRRSKIKDVLPENNEGVNIIPQILANNPDDFIYLAKYLHDLGYEEINWNLGCPFPMVVKQKLGSGLLPQPDEIKSILEKVMPVIPTKLSIKMRTGQVDENDIFKLLPILNDHPLTEVIIHPRVGKQMYKGEINLDVFEETLGKLTHKVTYNGDIINLETYQKLAERFNSVNSWMIGRGVVANPFLPEQIKQGGIDVADDRLKKFKAFHDDLFEVNSEALSGASHLLNKMLHCWEYFSQSFTNSHKVYKRVKKASTLDKYRTAMRQNFNEEEWIA